MVSSDNLWGNTGCWFADHPHHRNRVPAGGKVSMLHISGLLLNVHSAGACAEQPMQHFSGGTEQGMEASWWQQHLLVQLQCVKQIPFITLQHPMLTSGLQSMSFQHLSCVLCASSVWSPTTFSRYLCYGKAAAYAFTCRVPHSPTSSSQMVNSQCSVHDPAASVEWDQLVFAAWVVL